MIETTLQGIPLPLDQIPPTPLVPTPPSSENNFYGEHVGNCVAIDVKGCY